MATQAAVKPAPETKPQPKENDELREELLRQVTSLPHAANYVPNVVDKHFSVMPGTPLPELDTSLAKAFLARDSREPSRQLYALVCNPKMPARGQIIKTMLGAAVPGMVTLHAAGLAEIAGQPGSRLVLVYDRPSGKSLAAIMEERQGVFPESFVVERVVATIGPVLQYFAERGLCHGRINPRNVFFGETVMLGECASEPCGYSQPWQFEPADRAQSLPAGKGESIVENDTFSMGLLAAYLRLGNRLFDRAPTLERQVMRQLEYGTYAAMTANLDLSDAMTDLLRGTLNDNPKERWKWQQLKPWCKGRRYNMLPPAEAPSAVRPMIIGKSKYHNARMLSQGLLSHWDSTHSLLQDGTMPRWIDMSLRRRDMAEQLRRAVASLTAAAVQNAHQRDDLVSRAICILDPLAPLTRKEVRAHVSGIGCLIAEGYRTGNTLYIQYTLDMIEQGLPTVWADMHKRNDEALRPETANALWVLDRLRLVLRISGYGFGVERALYDLNPDLPCLTPLLEGHHAATLRDLLLSLDRVAALKVRKEAPLDRHIAGFIASKLSLGREVQLSEYKLIPRLAKHKAFVALRMFEQAQESAGRPRLPALTAWLSAELLNAVELFHSKTARNRLYDGIRQLADNGLFEPISAYINQRPFAVSDVDGFRQAIEAYFKMKQEVAELRNKRELKRKAAISGYSIAKYIAHIGLLAVSMMVLKEYWK